MTSPGIKSKKQLLELQFCAKSGGRLDQTHIHSVMRRPNKPLSFQVEVECVHCWDCFEMAWKVFLDLRYLVIFGKNLARYLFKLELARSKVT